MGKLVSQLIFFKNSTVPTRTTTTKFFILLFIFILEKIKNKFIEFNLRKKYIVFVKVPNSDGNYL